MRSARVLIAGALNDGEAPLIEDGLQTGEPRVKAERPAGRIGSYLQDVRRGHGDRRTTAVVEGVLVRDHSAERVVAAREVDDNEIARDRALRPRDVYQERRRGE